MAKLLARYQRQEVTDPAQHVEAPHPGYLGCLDSHFVGNLKSVGRVYAQTFGDTHCAWAAAKLYLSRLRITAIDLVPARVLPHYEAVGENLERVLTENGRE